LKPLIEQILLLAAGWLPKKMFGGAAMNWISFDLATALIGALAGVIFFFDGWRSNPKEVLPFYKTARITGFVWIVGGGVISGFLTYVAKQDQSRAMVVYISSFVVMVIACLIVATLALAGYYVLKYYGENSLKTTVTDAVPFTLHFLANGLDATLEQIEESRKQTEQRIEQAQRDANATTIQNLETSRLYTLQFINTVNQFVTEDIKSGRTGQNQFKFFLATQLRAFVVMFFEEKEILDRYRAAFFERRGDQLIFVEGADNRGTENEFSGKPLGLNTSLGGKAFIDNRILFFPKDSEAGYQPFDSESHFKTFVVIPVPYKPSSTVDERIGILSIDSVEENPSFEGEFQKRLLIYFSNVIAGTHSVYLAKATGGGSDLGKHE
jgi:hypothetical protein